MCLIIAALCFWRSTYSQIFKQNKAPFACFSYFRSFSKSCRSQLLSFFCQWFLFLQNRFFWYYPNETLSPFPWRQSQNCQVSALSKKKNLWGVFCNCQRYIFQQHVVSSKRWTFHIFGGWIQPDCESFYQNSHAGCVEVCQRIRCWINKTHTPPSLC